MKPIVFAILLTSALALAGCMPLEQAPLVYASRVQMGVGLVGGTAESPGLDVTIGYKQIDAAFVPVAVAKPCRRANPCAKVNYNVRIVKGLNSQAGRSSLDDVAAQTERDAIATADQQISSASKQVVADEAFLADTGPLTAKRSALNALKTRPPLVTAPAPSGPAAAPAATPAPTAADTAEIAQLEADITRLQAQVDPTKADLKAQQRLLETAAAKRSQAQANLEKILARMNRTSDDNKSDAYSVYGSFNGAAKGGSDGAALQLGKVFSTGVAAQNLSQGIRNGARADAMAKCLAAAAQLIPATASDAMRLAALQSCTTPEVED